MINGLLWMGIFLNILKKDSSKSLKKWWKYFFRASRKSILRFKGGFEGILLILMIFLFFLLTNSCKIKFFVSSPTMKSYICRCMSSLRMGAWNIVELQGCRLQTSHFLYTLISQKKNLVALMYKVWPKSFEIVLVTPPVGLSTNYERISTKRGIFGE